MSTVTQTTAVVDAVASSTAARQLSLAHGIDLWEWCVGVDDLNALGHAEDWRHVIDADGPIQGLNRAPTSDAVVPAASCAAGATERHR